MGSGEGAYDVGFIVGTAVGDFVGGDVGVFDGGGVGAGVGVLVGRAVGLAMQTHEPAAETVSAAHDKHESIDVAPIVEE